jgi:phage gpG-like protein
VLLVTIQLSIEGLDQIEQLADYWDIWFPARVLGLTGEAIVEDTRLRLEDDTTSPAGDPWDKWSTDYAKTRGAGDKLLFQDSTSGALSKSIESNRRGDLLEVGSALDYALVHQEGSRDGTIKKRQYAGVSRELEVGLDSVYESDFEGGWLAMRA